MKERGHALNKKLRTLWFRVRKGSGHPQTLQVQDQTGPGHPKSSESWWQQGKGTPKPYRKGQGTPKPQESGPGHLQTPRFLAGTGQGTPKPQKSPPGQVKGTAKSHRSWGQGRSGTTPNCAGHSLDRGRGRSPQTPWVLARARKGTTNPFDVTGGLVCDVAGPGFGRLQVLVMS